MGSADKNWTDERYCARLTRYAFEDYKETADWLLAQTELRPKVAVLWLRSGSLGLAA
ncbi:hypothetical protein EOD39_1286 [Acipenser ruthenus]|uniref:Uncharacterized protein n=1 Tax=Acipenser ruthenus TaxID=7906 RepID=A0A444UEH8_ACIRT|nr:hypothetical protein EOD39_1286 [Acipenser ruthenus]